MHLLIRPHAPVESPPTKLGVPLPTLLGALLVEPVCIHYAFQTSARGKTLPPFRVTPLLWPVYLRSFCHPLRDANVVPDIHPRYNHRERVGRGTNEGERHDRDVMRRRRGPVAPVVCLAPSGWRF